MRIIKVTYAKVAHQQAVHQLTLRPHDAGVDAFLIDHIRELQSKTRGNVAPLARFTSEAAHDLFKSLQSGTDEEFLNAAHSLTANLVGEMDGRAATGLFVCVRVVEHDGAMSAAALKLQVVTEHAAKLEQVESGELTLAAVRDVLDAPGDLQKGAVIDDPRAGSDVIIGDRLAQDAAYFPRALGIRTEQRAVDTAANLITAVAAHDQGVARTLITVLPQIPPGPTGEVLEQASARVPELTKDVIADVTATLARLPRPVNRVDTAAPVRTQIIADGVTVNFGPAAAQRVRVERDQMEGWRVVILSDAEPRIEYRR